jgi:hypothetical protein
MNGATSIKLKDEYIGSGLGAAVLIYSTQAGSEYIYIYIYEEVHNFPSIYVMVIGE